MKDISHFLYECFVFHTANEGHFALSFRVFVLHPLKVAGIRQSISRRIEKIQKQVGERRRFLLPALI